MNFNSEPINVGYITACTLALYRSVDPMPRQLASSPSLRIVRVSARMCVCGDRYTLRHHHGLPHLKVRAPLIGSFQVAQTSPKKTNRVLHTHAVAKA